MIRTFNKALTRLPRNGFNQRYGIWTTMTLTNSDGEVYLFRRRIFQLPWVALYLHDIEQGDDIVTALHSHPFPFVSLILRGGYTELVAAPQGTDIGPIEQRMHLRGDLNVFPRGIKKVHTIISALPHTKTLVLTGRRRDSWGWFMDGEGLVHWSEFLLREGKTPEGRRLTEKKAD